MRSRRGRDIESSPTSTCRKTRAWVLNATNSPETSSRDAPGVERNRAQIEMFTEEAFRLGLTTRHVTADEYFADYLQS